MTLPRHDLSHRPRASRMGFGRVQTFVGHAIDAYQMRFMALREHSRMTTYMFAHRRARKSVVEGKSVSVRVDLGGRRRIKKKTHDIHYAHDNTSHKKQIS